jgi:hypothetical protein
LHIGWEENLSCSKTGVRLRATLGSSNGSGQMAEVRDNTMRDWRDALDATSTPRVVADDDHVADKTAWKGYRES